MYDRTYFLSLADDLCKMVPIGGVDAFIVDYKTLIRAHIDYALMALFGLGFYGAGVELPVIA